MQARDVILASNLATVGYCLDELYITCPYHVEREYSTKINEYWDASGCSDRPLALRLLCTCHDFYNDTPGSSTTGAFAIKKVFENQDCVQHITLHSVVVIECVHQVDPKRLKSVKSIIMYVSNRFCLEILNRCKNTLEQLVIHESCNALSDVIIFLSTQKFPVLKSLSMRSSEISNVLFLNAALDMPCLRYIDMSHIAYTNVTNLYMLDKIVVNFDNVEDVAENVGLLRLNCGVKSIANFILNYVCKCNKTIDIMVNNVGEMIENRSVKSRYDSRVPRDDPKNIYGNTDFDASNVIIVDILKITSNCSSSCSKFKILMNDLLERIKVVKRFVVYSEVDAEGLFHIWNFVRNNCLKSAFVSIHKIMLNVNASHNLLVLNKLTGGKIIVKNFIWCKDTLYTWNSTRTAVDIAMAADKDRGKTKITCIVSAEKCHHLSDVDLSMVTDLHVVFDRSEKAFRAQALFQMKQLTKLSIYYPTSETFTSLSGIHAFLTLNVHVWLPKTIEQIVAISKFVQKASSIYVRFHENTQPYLVNEFFRLIINIGESYGLMIKVIVFYKKCDMTPMRRRSDEICRQNALRVFDASRYILYRDPVFTSDYIQCVSNGGKKLIKDIVENYLKPFY